MRCSEPLESLDPPPEGRHVFRAITFPMCIRVSEQTAMTAISPRLVTKLRSRGRWKRQRRGAPLRLRWDRGEGEGRRSMILSVLVSDGGANRFGLRGGCILGKCPSDRNKRERSGSVSNLDGGCVGRTCENGGIDDCIGGLIGDTGWKCRLGARYFGGGVIAVGEHLLSV